MAEGSAADERSSVTQTQVWIALGSMILSSAIFAASGVAARAAAGDVPPIALAFWRWAIAFLALLSFGWAPLWRGRAIVARNVPLMCVFALFGVIGFVVPYYIGLQTRPAVNGAVLNALGPVLTLFLAIGVLGTRINVGQAAGMVLALLGSLAILAQGSVAVLRDLAFEIGDLYLLVASLSWAIYLVLFKWRPAGLEEIAFLVAMAGFAVLMMVPLYVWELSEGLTFELTTKNIAIIGYTALFPSAFGYFCWSYAIRVLGPDKASMSQYLGPAFGVILAVILLGEAVYVYHLAGIALIFAGVFLTTRGAATGGRAR